MPTNLSNEPAFPQSESKLGNKMGDEHLGVEGLTKREYAAIMAMQGLLAGRSYDVNNGGEFWCQPKETAITAVQLADALLAKLARKEGSA